MEITRRQRDALWVIYMCSMLLDPVFLYVPVTKDDKKCFQFDTPLMIVGIAEHSLYVILFFMTRALRIWRYGRQNCGKYLLILLFDLSVILPLPQVLTLLAYNQVMSGRKFFSVMNLFLVQHGLKVIRLYALIKNERKSDDLTKWARFTFNLFFLHAANVIGASWYFFALQRKAKCWGKACTDSTGREFLPSLCNHSSRNYTCSNDSCSTKTQNATIYDFGIFHDAIKSGVMEQNNFFRRFFPCTQWSMQNLSSFGQSLPLSTNVLENIFAISITITGVLLFFFLIGKVQVEEFRNRSDSSLETLCDVVKPVVFTERSYVLQEGNPIDQMLFVLQGELRTYTSRSMAGSSSTSANLQNLPKDGDFSGEELIAWAKADCESSNVPVPTKTIQALTKVEAFVLMAYDLKQVLWNEQAMRLPRTN